VVRLDAIEDLVRCGRDDLCVRLTNRVQLRMGRSFRKRFDESSGPQTG
jgi:hypothetical protein